MPGLVLRIMGFSFAMLIVTLGILCIRKGWLKSAAWYMEQRKYSPVGGRVKANAHTDIETETDTET